MSGVVTIRPRDLPRVSARDAAALTRAARLLARLPRRLETPLGELGSIVLTLDGVDVVGAARGDAAGDVAFAISRGGDAGRRISELAAPQYEPHARKAHRRSFGLHDGWQEAPSERSRAGGRSPRHLAASAR